MEFLEKRHSVRSYEDKKIEDEKRAVLNGLVDEINKEGGLNIQICYDEPEAFNTFMAHYGHFDGVKNYVALVGKKRSDELIGYYGEKIVHKAQELGLNTCWVALTYGKGKTKITKNAGEKLYCVLALGYGKTEGATHKSKTIEQVSNVTADTPEWFINGVKASLLAPTAMNQQKFKFEYIDGKVLATAGRGFYTKIDLGIAKYHFEVGANRQIEWTTK